jgi:hypothetical protein
MQVSTMLSRTLWICASAAILASCNNAANVTPTRSQAVTRNVSLPMQSSDSASPRADSGIAGEELTATSYMYHCELRRQNDRWKVTFTANGETTGPFPGTFTASGRYGFRAPVSGGNVLIQVYERFTIQSGTRTLTGHIYLTTPGPYADCSHLVSDKYGFRLKYHIPTRYGHNWSGHASAVIDDPKFEENLQ